MATDDRDVRPEHPLPRPDDGSMTPPHGDELEATEIVNQKRNAHSEGYAAADDPDNDRPEK
jgi:hypothetical protein